MSGPDETAGECRWCGSTADLAPFAGQPRCGTCRELETAVSTARRHVETFGLRPLGAVLDGEDDEETQLRHAAHAASVRLRASRREEVVPAASLKRPRAAVRPRSGTSTTTIRRRAAPPAPVTDPEEKAAGLLTDLDAVDTELAELAGASGAAATGRVGDLRQKRIRILASLGALEKQRRSTP